MKFFRIDLLTLLISLFILSGCKNQDEIGLAPDQPLNGTLAVDTNIVVNTVLEDSVYTHGYAKTPVGYFKDPEIGATESNAAFALNLPLGTAYTLPTGTITIDSAVLVLRYTGDFYGDSLTSKYKMNVYQLNERPSPSQAYYNTYNWKVNNVLLGSKTFNARPRTSFKITDIVAGGADTLKKVPAHIRVPIDPEFIRSYFFDGGSIALGNNSIFQNNIRGLFVTMDHNQIGDGGLFSLALDSSSVAVYYRANTGGAIDTALVALPVAQHASQIKHTFTAPGVVAALANTTTTSSTFYVQGALGLRTKISFPNLADIKAKAGGNIVINRAELVITPNAGTGVPYKPIPKLTMYQLDNAKQRVRLQDADQGSTTTLPDPRYLGVTAFGGYYGGYVQSPNEYHFIITGYITDLMNGKTKDNGTYLGAVEASNFNAVDILAIPTALGRLVAAGTVTDKSSPNFNYKVKLNIVYTKLTK